MRWEQETSYYGVSDCTRAVSLLKDALLEGLINWTIYSLALEKITRVCNGSWMFERACADCGKAVKDSVYLCCSQNV